MNGHDSLMALARLALDPEHVPPSPCISVCRMDPDNGLCLGCRRSIDEIVAWGRMGEADKRLVWRRIMDRVASAAPQTENSTGPGE